MSEPITLSFSTPARQRVHEPVEVVLCGEEMTLQRPKDAVLYFAQVVAGDSVGAADRAYSLVQFLNSLFDETDRKRFFERILDRDDPVHLQETVELVAGVLDRWANYPAKGSPEPVVVEPFEHDDPPEPVWVVHEDLDLRFEACPPKDIVSLFAAGSLGAGVSSAQEAWAIGLFLGAALDHQDEMMVAHRMRSPHDDLDLEHVAEIVSELAQRWAPGARNREQRRAAARATRSTTSTRARSSTAKTATRAATSAKATGKGGAGRARSGSSTTKSGGSSGTRSTGSRSTRRS